MIKHSARPITLAAAISAASLSAQQAPPVRPLGPVVRVSAAGLLGSVSAVRALQNGSVIVNDVTRRQLLYLDSAFHVKVVIADTTATPGGYNAASQA